MNKSRILGLTLKRGGLAGEHFPDDEGRASNAQPSNIQNARADRSKVTPA